MLYISQYMQSGGIECCLYPQEQKTAYKSYSKSLTAVAMKIALTPVLAILVVIVARSGLLVVAAPFGAPPVTIVPEI